MKSIPIIFAFLLTISTFTFSQDTLYVYKAGVVAYKSVISEVDSLSFSKIYPQTTGTVLDIDGNSYKWRTIGTQTWMTENLKTTKYRNGDVIDNLPLSAEWAGTTTGAWCDYLNETSNGTKYGHLYNWLAVSDVRNIAPTGWHVATDDEWLTLTNYVTSHLGTSVSITKAISATTDWAIDGTVGNTGNDIASNNSSGFNALPGGNRAGNALGGEDGKFESIGNGSNWWSGSECNTTHSWVRYYYSAMNYVVRSINHKSDGFSVRCVRD